MPKVSKISIICNLMIMLLICFFAFCFVGCGEVKQEAQIDEPQSKATSTWDGSSSIWTSGSGTEASPYIIATAANLAYLAEHCTSYRNCYFKQTVIINLNSRAWRPINDNVTSNFVCYYDGNGQYIQNLVVTKETNSSNYYVGLFGRLSGGYVKNLGIYSGTVTSIRPAGGICGYADNVTFTSCYNKATIKGSTNTSSGVNNQIGGVCGYAWNCTFTSCYNTGAITGNREIGGVLGSGSAEMISCYNSGTITGNSSVGGVCGSSGGTLNSCYNTGTVTGSDKSGGVCGYASGTLISCYSSASITGTGVTGGLVGYASNLRMRACYKTSGSVSSTGQSASDYVGGLVGCGTVNEMLSCYCSVTVSTSYSYCGGLIGYVDYSSNLKYSYNTGSVTGLYAAGGLIGRVSGGNTIIQMCYNSGSVTSNNTYAGGLAGDTNGINASYSYNRGTIKSVSRTGGLVGDGSNDRFEYCYSTGSLSVTDTTNGVKGGLAGYCSGYAYYSYFLSSTATNATGSGSFGIDAYSGGKTSSQMQGSPPSGMTGFTSAVWTFSSSAYPTLRFIGVKGLWTDYATIWTSGEGTASNPYKIASPANLAYLVNNYSLYSGCYFKQTASFSLSAHFWVPIDVPYVRLDYDGGGYSVQSLYILDDYPYMGLFGRFYGDIRNLGISGGSIISSSNNVYCGALVGFLRGGSQIISCYNTAEVVGNYKCGGLIGYAEGNHNFVSCYNSGAITSPYSGGLIGDASGGYGKISFYACYNTGKIVGSGEYYDYAGGLVGYGSVCEFTGCYNSAVITSNYYAGGLVANTSSVGFSGCRNTSSVTGGTYVGGLVGCCNYSATIISSYNSAAITANNSGGVGGLCGYGGSSESAIMFSYNTGTVKGVSCIGGLAGKYGGKIKSSFNASNVTKTGEGNYLGGLVGDPSGGVYLLTSYYNTSLASGVNICGNEYYSIDSYSSGRTTSQMQGTTPSGFATEFKDTNIWTFSSSAYPTLKTSSISSSWLTQASKWTSGSGTESSPYQIASAANLAYLSLHFWEYTGCYFKQTATISLASYWWVPIGMFDNSDYNYNSGCYYDGNGYVINNLYTGGIYAGLFGEIHGGTFNKVAIGSGIVVGDEYVGGVGGSVWGSLTNCYNKATIIGRSNVGGVAGQSGDTTTSCYNQGKVYGIGNVGGVAGAGSGYIKGSYNTVAISGFSYVGGVVGSGGTLSETCYNTGKVDGYHYVGGLSGGNSSITSCNNSGTVTGNAYVGGLIGYASAGVASSANTGTISGVDHIGGIAGYCSVNGVINNCTNSVNLTSTGNYLGGFVGSLYGRITNCHNTVTVSGASSVGGLVGGGAGIILSSYNSASVTGTGNHIGGLAGSGSHTISSCYNNYAVSGGSYVGGLVGSGSPKINKSYNNAAISGGNRIGGLVGSGSPSIIVSYNMSSVTGGGSYVGGLLGYADNYCEINNAYNQGAVKGATYVGGLLGYNSGTGTFVVDTCYNASTITKTSNYSGGIVGYSNSGTLRVNYCYFDSSLQSGLSVVGYSGGTVNVDSYSKGLATSSMKGTNPTSMVGFTTDWWTFASSAYPILKPNTMSGLWTSYGSIWTAGDGSEGNPYQIASAANLAYLAKYYYSYSGKYFIQTANISLDGHWWVPINASGNDYTYYYNGNNKTITHMYTQETNTYTGLFGRIYGGSITNLGIISWYITGTNYVGAFVGYNSRDLTITNCYNTSLVYGAKHVGGLVGYSCYGLHITNSNNTASVFGNNNIGGLVGYIASSSDVNSTISSSYNTGKVEGYQCVGGLCGSIYGGDSAHLISVSSCYNQGSVLGYSYGGGLFGQAGHLYLRNGYSAVPILFAGSYVGGIIGKATGTLDLGNIHNTSSVSGAGYVGGLIGSSESISLDSQSYNSGAVSGTSNYVGGLVGVCSGTNVVGSFNGCSNSGNITGMGNVGGIVGNADGTSVTFCNCYNTGSVTSTNSGYVGGIVGRILSSAATMTGCSNTKAITCNNSYSDVGGLVGAFSNSGLLTMTNSHNTGIVFTKGGNVGGLIGQNSGELSINGCYNTGNVTSDTSNYVGGLVGYSSTSSKPLSLTNSYNTGTISSKYDYAGGLVGYAYHSSESISLTNCYNTGSVTSTNYGYVGGLVGRGVSTGSEKSITIKNCYNTGTIEGHNYYVGGLISYVSTSNFNLEDSYNKGNMTGTNAYVGGLVGYVAATMTLKKSMNGGTVTSTNSYVGGLIGYFTGNSSNPSKITSCANSAAVSGTQYVGGFIGDVSGSTLLTISKSLNDKNVTGTNAYVGGLVGRVQYTTTISDSYCWGDVSGTNYVGGIIGYCYNNFVRTINSCYSTGTITSTSSGSYSGGIVGYRSSGTLTLGYCYYKTGSGPANIVGYGTFTNTDNVSCDLADNAMKSSGSNLPSGFTNTEVYWTTENWYFVDAKYPLLKDFVADKPTTETVSFEYTGLEIAFTLGESNDEKIIRIGDLVGTAIGTYSITLTLKPGCFWEDGTQTNITTPWYITRIKLTKPTLSPSSFLWTGSNQSPTIFNYDSTHENQTGTLTAKDVNNYNITYSIKDKTHYMWADGTDSNVVLNWSITKVVLKTPTITNNYKSFSYSGSYQSTMVSYYKSSCMTHSGTIVAKDVGTYTVNVSLSDTAHYIFANNTNSVTLIWSITSVNSSSVKSNSMNSYDVWDGTTSSGLSGTGSVDDPYLITSGADLAHLRSYASSYNNKYFKQTKNIDLDNIAWVPINNGTTGYYYFYDGDGHKIKNINITGTSYSYSGLFGGWGAGGYVKNLGLESGTISPTSSYVGGIIGYLTVGSAEFTMSNCYNKATISPIRSGTTDYYGGLIGYASKSTSTTTFNIQNCYNSGEITHTSTSRETNLRMGGLVGCMLSYGPVNISNSYNTGDITYEYSYASYATYTGIGGLLGSFNYSGSSSDSSAGNYGLTIEYVYNEGAISGTYASNRGHTSSYLYVGGFIGIASTNVNSNSGPYTQYITIQNFYNKGSVSSVTLSTSIGYCYAGGVIGHCYMYNASSNTSYKHTTTLTISSGYNSASITATGVSASVKGAIIGYRYLYRNISDSYGYAYGYLNNFYYDNSTSTTSDLVGQDGTTAYTSVTTTGSSGLSTANMKAGNNSNMSGLSATNWYFRNGYYPELKVYTTIVDLPTANVTSFVYNGNAQGPVLTYDSSVSSIKAGSVTSATNKGNYAVTFVLNYGYAWSTDSIADYVINWTISEMTLDTPAIASGESSVSYSFDYFAPMVDDFDGLIMTATGTKFAKDCGNYSMTVVLTDTTNYKLANNSTSVILNWAITTLIVNKPTITGTSFTYNGNPQGPTISSYNTNYINKTGTNSETNAGSYNVTFSLKDTNNTKWSDNTTAAISTNWSIAKQSLTKPTKQSTSFTYNGSEVDMTNYLNNYNSSTMTIGGNYKKTNAGNYTLTVSLKDTTNYQWNDNTITAVSIDWSIAKLTLSVPTLNKNNFTFNKSPQGPTITYDSSKCSIASGSTQTATHAGSYNIIIAINDTTNYVFTGNVTSVTLPWTISPFNINDGNPVIVIGGS